ncbi:helix-turn-helix domain-containing protein [Luteolibacter algae]|uniref:Helix-turn-helix domain-containing protein n=1 Tax=Luteolibacter algae TaxID=454151 RepID=A0ABW5D3L8_9BACT
MEESLGDRLRSAREAAGITVDDAVYLAKMPRAVVEALESENFGFFSSPLYAKSFLRQYSEYIGADVDPWLDDLVPATMIDGQIEAFIDLSDPVPMAPPREKRKDSNSNGAFAAIWLVVFTGALIWGGFKLFEKFDSSLSEGEDPQSKIVVEKPEPAPTENSEEVTKETDPVDRDVQSIVRSISEPAPRAIPVRE